MTTTDLLPSHTGANPLYDPPSGVQEWERFVIGNALIHKLVQEMREVASFKYTAEKSLGDLFDQQKFDDAVVREIERCLEIYKLMCKWVPKPMPWDFYVHWLDVPLGAG